MDSSRAIVLLYFGLQFVCMISSECNDAAQVVPSRLTTTTDLTLNETEIDIQERLSSDTPMRINSNLNETESNIADQTSYTIPTEETIVEEKSDAIPGQLTMAETINASSTGKDPTETYTTPDLVDNYEIEKSTTESLDRSTIETDVQSIVVDQKTAMEYSDKLIISNSSVASANNSKYEDDDRYVKISFVTNSPKITKTQEDTTRRIERSTTSNDEKIFKFWTTLSVQNPPSTRLNVNIIKDNKPISGHLVTVQPPIESQIDAKYNNDSSIDDKQISANTSDVLDDEDAFKNHAKIGYDIDIDQTSNAFIDGIKLDAEPEDKDLSDDEKDAMEAEQYGLERMKELYEIEEPKLYNMGLWLEPDNPARFVATFNWQSEEARRYAQYGYASLQASAHLKQKFSDEFESRVAGSEKKPPKLASLKQSTLRQQCPLKGTPRCPPASKRYRTHDGTCNNPRRGRWGSALTPVERFLAPRYEDEVNEARGARDDLPSARLISSRVHVGRHQDAAAVSHLLMQWGQFLDHDITSSSQARAFNGSIPRCCLDRGRHFVPSQFMHPDCMPIEVPDDDPFYGPMGIRCLEFVRSSPAPRVDCEFGWREQMNQVTAYIDGSPIYSSSARQADKLRLFRNGMLQYGRAQARRPLLPPREDDEEALCQGGAVDASCFKAGDGRVNEHPGLVAIHIIWLRKHNRLATELGHLNPHWSDEKIYQETRKIIGAFIQHITYKEFLPIVLGSEVMQLFDLNLVKKGYYNNYNSKVNPSPASAFGAAAFRFGHSLVQDSFMRYDRFHRPLSNNVSLHDELSNPSNIWSFGAVDRLILGMCNQPSQRRDEFISPELTNHLFQTSRFGFGMDLAAINIQRGRDHGLAPYVEWREPCGLTPVREWSDLFKIMPLSTIRNLQDVYRHVDEIDLFTGGMAERPVVGGLVGPTFACIIAQQFSNLRRGDRFWYENGHFESSFTPAQLQQIRKISLAQILCQTLESIVTIQPFVFLTVDDFRNERIPCSSDIMNNFDLTPWTERDAIFSNNINDFDRTNFLKSSSVRPHSTNKISSDSLISSTTKRIPFLTTKRTNLLSTPIELDGKIDLLAFNTQNSTSKTTDLFEKRKEPTDTGTTTATPIILDGKLDFPFNLLEKRKEPTNTKHTTVTPIELDGKIDLSFNNPIAQINTNSTDDINIQSIEQRSFSKTDDISNNQSISALLSNLNKVINSTLSEEQKYLTDDEKGSEKTYGFLLNEDSQLPFFSNFFSRKTTTTESPRSKPNPQISLYPYDSSTSPPNRFTYLINIVPKTTPKYDPNYPSKETIKITVQGSTPSKTKPQSSIIYPYDKRPVYDNNKLEYRPVNTYNSNFDNNNYQPDYVRPQLVSNTYNRPQSQQNTYGQSHLNSNQNNYLSNSQIADSGVILTNNRPYRPYRPSNNFDYSTEYNPYSLVTFSHVETTKKYNMYQPQYDAYFPDRRPTRPTLSNLNNNFGYGQQPKPVISQDTKPSNTGITIYIENKPPKPKPTNSYLSNSNNGYGSFTSKPRPIAQNPYSSNDETIPLFTRPSYQRPLMNRPLTNTRPSYQRPQSSDSTRPGYNSHDSSLTSEHGQFSNAWSSHFNNMNYPQSNYNQQSNKYPINKLSTSNVNINLASDYGNQNHAGISIVIDPNLKNKRKPNPPNDYQSLYKSYSTTKAPLKYYYIGNVLHKYTQSDDDNKTLSEPSRKRIEILSENYNNIWKPNKDEHKLYYDPSEEPYEESLDSNYPMSDNEDDSHELIDKVEGFADRNDDRIFKRNDASNSNITSASKREAILKGTTKLRNKNKGQVFFEIIPSENSPKTWTVYNEKPEENIPDSPYNVMPLIEADPQASKELPRPMILGTVMRHPARRKPSRK